MYPNKDTLWHIYLSMSMQRFPNKLRTLREAHDMSLQDVANVLGTGRSFVHKMEIGLRKPNVEMLIKIARLFHVSLDDLALDERDVG